MKKNRIEAFSDGVIAIIITIMVLELKVPHSATWDDLVKLAPVFGSYVLSFIYVAIYWNNHHHLFHATERVSGRILWANIHWLFWLSLMPFASGWMGENHLTELSVAFYGFVLLATALAYVLLTHMLVTHHGVTSSLGQSIGSDRKGKVSIALYVTGIVTAFYQPWISCLLYAVVAAIWFIPDRRIESVLPD
ncbi:MAG: DUF1211 domain-containing protein [Caedimonadaceae bacterium]|nr:MAG: DUF1211 domain-containing protein [Caedimonadaceae bacterium]